MKLILTLVNKKPANKQAFTLIELLLVLAIAWSVLFFTNVSFRQAQSTMEAQRFFNRFEREIKITQMTALIQGRPTDLLVSKKGIYFTRTQTSVLRIPKGIVLVNNGQLTVKFASFSGYSASTDQVVFEWKDGKETKKRTYIFKLGGGLYVL